MADTPGQHTSPAQQLLERISGYWLTQVIGTVARLGVADLLASGPRLSDEVARETGCHPDGLYRLLRGGVSAGLFLETSPRTFSLTEMGGLLRSDVPGSMRDVAIAQSDGSHWLPWGRLTEAVRTGRSSARAALGTDLWEHFSRNPDEAAHFGRAMGNLSTLVADELTRLIDFSPHARVADIGGNQGDLLGRVLRAYPSCRGILFDLPRVIEGARARVAAEGLADRMELVGGSFLEPGLPAADAYLLKYVLHDWDDASCTTLLRNLHQAAPEGARLFVLDLVMPDDGRPSPVPLMDLNMLVLVDGRERTARELEALLTAASWKLERITPTRSGTCIIEARKEPRP